MINSWLKCNDTEKDLIAQRIELLLFCFRGSRGVFKNLSLQLIARLLTQLIKIIAYADSASTVNTNSKFQRAQQKEGEINYFVAY